MTKKPIRVILEIIGALGLIGGLILGFVNHWLYSRHPDIMVEWEIMHTDQEQDLIKVILSITNTGNCSIPKSDFDGDIEILIENGKLSLDSLKFVSSNRDTLNPPIKLSSPNSIVIPPLLLNRNDDFKFMVNITQSKPTDFYITLKRIRIEGIPNPHIIKRSPTDINKQTTSKEPYGLFQSLNFKFLLIITVIFLLLAVDIVIRIKGTNKWKFPFNRKNQENGKRMLVLTKDKYVCKFSHLFKKEGFRTVVEISGHSYDIDNALRACIYGPYCKIPTGKDYIASFIMKVFPQKGINYHTDRPLMLIEVKSSDPQDGSGPPELNLQTEEYFNLTYDQLEPFFGKYHEYKLRFRIPKNSPDRRLEFRVLLPSPFVLYAKEVVVKSYRYSNPIDNFNNIEKNIRAAREQWESIIENIHRTNEDIIKTQDIFKGIEKSINQIRAGLRKNNDIQRLEYVKRIQRLFAKILEQSPILKNQKELDRFINWGNRVFNDTISLIVKIK